MKLEIGIFVLKNRRKIGKSIVLSSTKIASLHLITVIIKATSPQLVRSQDLDQLSQLRRRENDQKRLVYRLRYAAIGMICFTTGSSWRPIVEKLRRVKFLRMEISYDCVVIEGYRTRIKKSYGKLSFH